MTILGVEWTVEELELLCRRWNEGASAGVIATELAVAEVSPVPRSVGAVGAKIRQLALPARPNTEGKKGEWTGDELALLRRRWGEGASASIIAKDLAGAGISPQPRSRSAVLGKIHRLGLAGRDTRISHQNRPRRPKRKTDRKTAPPARQRAPQGAVGQAGGGAAAEIPPPAAGFYTPSVCAEPNPSGDPGPRDRSGFARRERAESFPKPEPVPFLERRAGQCCFPLWGFAEDVPIDEKKVCGAAVAGVEGPPYCAAHRQIAGNGFPEENRRRREKERRAERRAAREAA